MPWKAMLAYVTGEVDESLLVRVEYLIEENRVLNKRTDKRVLPTPRMTFLTRGVKVQVVGHVKSDNARRTVFPRCLSRRARCVCGVACRKSYLRHLHFLKKETTD